jgi:hypothetical protein
MGMLWRRICRWVLWDYPRAGWQYDLMVVLILAFIFLTPRDLFRDQPRPTSIVMLEGHEGLDVLWIAPELLQAVPESEKSSAATALIAKKLGRGVTLVRLDTILDAEKQPTGYMALVKP